MRGIFQHEYGVDLNKVTWVCNDDGHLAEFKDPPNVERTPPDAKKVDQMLLDGEIDGAILGAEIPDEPRVAHLIPESARGGARLAPQVRHRSRSTT